MKLMCEGTRIKELRVTGNLNYINTRTKMANLAPQQQHGKKIKRFFTNMKTEP